MSKEQKRDELTEIIIKANEDWLKEFGRMHLHLEHKAEYIAAEVVNAGYRKQSEGEWVQQLRPYEDEIKCTACGAIFNIIDNCTEKFNHCPNCGAKMKGGE